MIKIKRGYDKPDENDGFRVLVDRLWPRGLSKERAKVDLWLQDIAPSHELRKWFAHDPKKWGEFKQKYFKELDHKKELVNLIIKKAKGENVTLLYGAKDEHFNNAVSLKEYVEAKRKGSFNMTSILLHLLLGLVAGTFSGLIGIGGGTIIVPVLVFLFGLSQHQAQGTTLALLVPPIGFFAAWTYYKQGYVDLKIAALICVGFFSVVYWVPSLRLNYPMSF